VRSQPQAAPGAGRDGDGVYIGLDLGTSGLKGVALDASGAVVARGAAAYPTSRPAAGACEQDTGDWLTAVDRVAAQLAATIPADQWRGIGLSGMIPTLVTLDAAGRPTGPAITWQDSRADALGDALRERCGPQPLYELTGQWVDGRYLLPMFGSGGTGAYCFDFDNPVPDDWQADAATTASNAHAAAEMVAAGWHPDDVLASLSLPTMRYVGPPGPSAQTPTTDPMQARKTLPELMAGQPGRAAVQAFVDQFAPTWGTL